MTYHLVSPKIVHWDKDFDLVSKANDIKYFLEPRLAFYDKPDKIIEGVKSVHEIELRWRWYFVEKEKTVYSIIFEQLIVLLYNPCEHLNERIRSIISLSHFCVQHEYYLNAYRTNMHKIGFPEPTSEILDEQVREMSDHMQGLL